LKSLENKVVLSWKII